MPPATGFVLVVADFEGNVGSNMAYVSNIERQKSLEMLLELVESVKRDTRPEEGIVGRLTKLEAEAEKEAQRLAAAWARVTELEAELADGRGHLERKLHDGGGGSARDAAAAWLAGGER
ncbi:MAG: hypothetical protein RIF41_32300 [Polyangiaceae bacterium]